MGFTQFLIWITYRKLKIPVQTCLKNATKHTSTYSTVQVYNLRRHKRHSEEDWWPNILSKHIYLETPSLESMLCGTRERLIGFPLFFLKSKLRPVGNANFQTQKCIDGMIVWH